MSLPNYWTKRLPTLKDHLGIPFGDEIVCNDKPAELLNKRIDYNKNEIVNLPAGQGGGEVPDATTTIKGKVELAENGENLANVVVQGNDSRLTDARTPLAHTHVKANITDFDHTHTKSQITDFSHTHVKADISDFTHSHLAADLPNDVVYDSDISNVIREGDSRLTDSRTPLAHTHVKADITDFTHSHTKSEISDFAHTHVKTDITDFAHTHVTTDITDFPDVGEDNTGANVGTGQGNVFRNKTGVTLNLKTLKSGTNITITDNADDVTIAASGGAGGEANTSSNQGTGEGTLAMAKNGVDLPFKTLKQGSNITITNNANDVTIASTGGGGGEANTSSNVGTGDGQLAKPKSGVDLPFKTIKDGTNVDVVNNTDDVTINVPDASTTVKGAVELADNNESGAGLAVQSNDTRMSNARTPTAHTHIKSEITDFSHTHVKADVTDFAHTHVKADVTDFSHTHTKSEITDFTHTHVKTDITDFAHTHLAADLPDATTTGKGIVQLATDGESNANEVCVSNDSRLSNARSPTAHTHVKADITDFTHTHVKADITDFTHTHVKADITDFTHTHTKSEITDFAHTHAKADLPTATAYEDESNTYTSSQTVNALLEAQKNVKLTGFISPTAITGNTNNYNPSGLATAIGIRQDLSGSATITGITAQADKTVLIIINISTSFNLTLSNENASSTDVNRLSIGGNLTLNAGLGAILIYDGTLQRWKAIASPKPPAGTINTSELASDGVTYDKIQNVVSDDVLLGRISGAGGNVEEVTPAQARTLLGITSENVGTATGAANGSSTVFNIAHSLGSTPAMALVIVSSVLGSTINFSYTYDSTNIVVTFASAPSTGTITFQWRAVA